MLTLYAHPFSSYCQKALIAFYENEIAFAYRVPGAPDDPAAGDELARIWPLKLFPVLVDAGRTVLESSIIVEHLSLHHPGPVPLLPADPRAALEVRMLDRLFDNYVMAPMMKIVADAMRAEGSKDAVGVADAHGRLDRIYDWLDDRLAGRRWAAGDAFSLADCAAAPALFYADWVHAIGADRSELSAYRARLLARPSFARAVEEARPYRPNFPPGAPDRD